MSDEWSTKMSFLPVLPTSSRITHYFFTFPELRFAYIRIVLRNVLSYLRI